MTSSDTITMDIPDMDRNTAAACQLSKLSAEAECLRNYNDILLQRIRVLEKESVELNLQIRDMKQQYNNLLREAAERKIYTSMMETNNRINERKIKELKQEIDRLKASNKRLVWEYEKSNKRIREEHAKHVKDKEAMFQTVLETVVSQNSLIVGGLRESLADKNAMISLVLRNLMMMHKANSGALMALAGSHLESSSSLETPIANEEWKSVES